MIYDIFFLLSLWAGKHLSLFFSLLTTDSTLIFIYLGTCLLCLGLGLYVLGYLVYVPSVCVFGICFGDSMSAFFLLRGVGLDWIGLEGICCAGCGD